MKRATTYLLTLFVWLAPEALAQDARPAEQPDIDRHQVQSRGIVAEDRLPFAPALRKEQIDATVAPVERQRLHPFFQAVVARERLGLARPLDPQAARNAPGVALREDGEPVYSAMIHTRDAAAVEALGIHVNSAYEGLVTARLTPEQAERLAAESAVRLVEPSELLYPANDMGVPATGAHLLHEGLVRNTPYQGEEAVVCVFDTGIDYRHEDFIDETGNSRILSLWDQTLDDLRSGEQRPSGFDYGVEYTREDIAGDLESPGSGFVRQRDTNGHGTHVAGTAAGNGRGHHGIYKGMAPNADLVIVKGGDSGFPETNTIDGINYCGQVAQAEGKPVVVNLSLSGHFGPHDGSRGHERVIEQFAGQPGRVVVASAGNSGNEAIHLSGNVPAGGTRTLEFEVPPYNSQSGNENDYFRFDTWFDADVDISATVTSAPANGTIVSATYEVGETGTHDDDRAGTIYVFNSSNQVHNGEALRINMQIYDDNEQRPPASGTWELTFTNNTGQEASFHGWLYSVSNTLSAINLVGGDSLYTVGSPATSRGAITVGSFNARTLWPSTNGRSYRFLPEQPRGDISNFSSIGPTRDGRLKPDLVAPGRAVVSSRSANGSFGPELVAPGDRHRIAAGTSMSAPHVTGAVALLLSQFPSHTSEEIRDLLITAANEDDFTQAPLPGISDTRLVWGAGKLNVFRAMVQAFGGSVAEEDRYHYAGEADAVFSLGDQRAAVRVTPDQAGILSGFEVHMANLNQSTGIYGSDGEGHLLYALYDDDNGLPGEPITEVLARPLKNITPTSRSHFSLLAAGIDNLQVEADKDYHIVFYLEDGSETFEFYQDDGSSSTGRSSVYNPDVGLWQPTTLAVGSPVEFAITGHVARVDEAAETPVALEFFNVESPNGDVRLSWRTTMQRDIQRIEIEHARPRDSANFVTIGEVEGAGTTEEPREYSFAVNDFEGVGEHRFRLRFVGETGAWSYSDTKSYLQEVEGRYELSQPYPNPFTESANVRLSVAEEQHVEVFVYDLLGRRIAKVWDEPIPANFEEIITFDAPALSSGMYVLHVIGDHFQDARMVTKVQ